MKLSKMFLMLALVSATATLGCSDDSGSGGTAGSGGTGGTAGETGGGGETGTSECIDGELCGLEACLVNDGLCANCLREYDNCVDLGGDNCKAAAEETCTL